MDHYERKLMDINKTADNIERGVITKEDRKTMTITGIVTLATVFALGFLAGRKSKKTEAFYQSPIQ
jgi:hypothetical protein